ncbi:MAG TPA: glycosyltransferase family 39 protein [Thermoleophilaceae bacterium]|nr:glycosyltransferase family 39 protein [Thermoleophilaceae bacterium]
MRDRSVQVLAALTVLAAILRFPTLHVQSYWFDEAVTVRLVSGSFGHMLSSIGGSESTPPLYYMLAWVWTRIFGHGEAGLRSLSALAGTAFVPVAYAAAAELAARRVALAIAALTAFSPLLIWYSQEARSYALLVLFAGLSFWLFARLAREQRDRDLAWWTLVSALAIATHYFAAFVVAPEAAWLLLRARDRRRPLVAIGALLAVGGALLPLLLRQRRLDLTSFITESSLAKRVALVAKQFVVGYSSPGQTAVIAAGALLILLGLALVWSRSVLRERRAALLGVGIGLAAVGIPIVLALAGADYLDTRNLLGAWLPLMLVPALGYRARRAGRTGLTALVALCALGLFVSVAVWANPRYQRDNNRGLARALGPAVVPRAIVVTPVSASVPLGVYMQPFAPAVFPVREVDLVALAQRSALFSGSQPPPRPGGHQPPAPGLKLVEQRYTSTYSLLRFRSAQPVTIPPAALLFNRLDPRAAAVLFQR